MNKAKSFRRLSVLILAVLVMTTTILCGTFAKYMTSIEATADITVAKWNFKADGNTANYTLELSPNSYSNVKSNTIAPGTSGSFDIVLANDSDVAAVVDVIFTASNKPANLKFYTTFSNGAYTGEITEASGSYNVLTDSAMATDATQTVTVYWDWAFGSTAESDQSTIATGSYAMNIKVTVSAEQAQPSPATT